MSAMTLDASEVAALLREFGQRMALRGGNPFRAKSYARAADSLLALTRPLDGIIREDRLREIPGAGDAIAGIIAFVLSSKRRGIVGSNTSENASCSNGGACHDDKLCDGAEGNENRCKSL